MKTVAVVPAKELAVAKSRLSSLLTGEERANLALAMLDHVLRTIVGLPAIDACAVVTGDPRARALASDLNAFVVAERGGGLNRALEVGRGWALEHGAEALLVLLSDLPLVEPDDLADLVRRGQASPVVIAPSRDGGTNAMLLRPPLAIPFRFGHQSADRHHYEATRRGLRVTIVRRNSLAFDVDSPADLLALPASARPSCLACL